MVFTDPSLSRCDELRAPGVINLIVSIFIVVGMLISYLPQHYRIIARGTSEGISPYFVLLGVTSATAGFANILTLPQSREDVACCTELDTFHCMAGLLGITQLGVQWICFATILVLFLVFFRYDDANVPIPENEIREDQPRWQTAVMVACLSLLHGLIIIVITAIIATVYPNALSGWANALGLMAAVLAAVQYVPQIYTTYHLKHAGSLSISMMCMQTPGGVLFAGSLFARLGWAGWSSWGIFLLSAIMQGAVLGMCIYYEIARFQQLDDSFEDDDNAEHANGNGIDTGGDGTSDSAPPKKKAKKRPLYRRVLSYRSARLDDSTPSRYSAHPEHYGSTPDEISDIIDRQDSDAATETQPLLRPGGIGNPQRGDYGSTQHP